MQYCCQMRGLIHAIAGLNGTLRLLSNLDTARSQMQVEEPYQGKPEGWNAHTSHRPEVACHEESPRMV